MHASNSTRRVSRLGSLLLVTVCAACNGTEGSLGAVGGGSEGLDPGPEELDEPAVRSICGDEATPVREQPSLLSDAFENSCAGCHGSLGEGVMAPGVDAAPPLDHTLTFEQYLTTVRQGRHEGTARMPAFDSDLVSDEMLYADWEILAATSLSERAQAAQLRPVVLPGGLGDPAAVEEALAEGLAIWREPGKRGSCAGCHGPEGIDLARLGYRDSDILRRAVGQEMTDAESHALVRMVRALRDRYEMEDRCDPRQPFLQPGGAVLPGQTVPERDLAVVDELRRHGIDLEERIVNVEQAHEFLHRLLEVGFMNIRVPFEFNRWTEDRALGEDRRSVAEWIPEYAREPVPGREAEWFALSDAYMADPSEENLWSLYDAVPELTEPALDLAGGSSPDSTSAKLMMRRYQSVLIAQHMMRHNVVEFPRRYSDEEREYLWGGLQLAQSKDERQEELLARDALWDAGEIAMTINRGHSDELDLAPFIVEKMSWESEDSKKILGQDFGFAAVPWMWLGLASDPALQVTNGGRASTEYFETRFTRTLDVNTTGSGWPKRPNEYLLARELQAIMISVGKTEGIDEGIPTNNFGREGFNGRWAHHKIWRGFNPPSEDGDHSGGEDDSSPPEYEGIERQREQARRALQLNFQRAAFFLTVVDMQRRNEYGQFLANPEALTRMRDHLIAAGPEEEAPVWRSLHEMALAAWSESECVSDKCDDPDL
ncbi:MAG: c-type cytochrome [Myxococcota bacterium]